ncbi:uncharacterized protein A4U43_C10F18930 [Asparagus officinalis]|uniref:Uncharacterized protein n=1 Tax=Asparagus officinalis TaxID=4686 RepID=A0A5P1E783_ASPOF|nr:uncharacterized protein LOC109824980 [Asparagus officinalis]ONK57327.1 uncharacterized protein A4U43_C10F18930 [Asparagus officinalis]
MASKKAIFILFVILASLVSASFAGGHRKLMKESTIPMKGMKKDQSLALHPRILVVKTNDYGRYDPSPSFSKPRFKPIPN